MLDCLTYPLGQPVAESAVGQVSLVSAEESTAKITSTLRMGWMRGLRGMFWLSSPPSTRVSCLLSALGLVSLW